MSSAFLNVALRHTCRVAAPLALAATLAASVATTTASSTVGAAPRYDRAEAFLRWNANKLVTHDPAMIHWIGGTDRLWYREWTGTGYRFVLADAKSRVQGDVFDSSLLARALAAISGCPTDAEKLPFQQIHIDETGRLVAFFLRVDCGTQHTSGWYQVDRQSNLVTAIDEPSAAQSDVSISPDGRHVASIDAFNLSVRTVGAPRETAVTKDGADDFYYASAPQVCCEGRTWGLPPKDIDGIWSPDSRYFLTYQVDLRQAGRNFLISTGGLRGKLLSYPFPQPGDLLVPVVHPLVIDTLSGELARVADVAPISFFNAGRSQYFDVQWAADSKSFYILKTLRGSRRAELYRSDPKSGRSELIFSEDSDTFLDAEGMWRVSRDGKTLLWYSTRGGWGQLYRVDLATRQFGAALTPAGSDVRKIEGFDESQGWVYFTGQGREHDVYPYAQQFYRMHLDGSQLTRLTPESVNHKIFMSPTGRYFVDIAGLHDRPNITLLKRNDGRQVRVLERSDASGLFAAGWRAPELVEAPNADGRFKLYGLLYKPSTVEPGRRYPLLDLVYPGPHNGPTRIRGFTTDPSNNPQAFAELGFMVLALTTSGTDGRGRAFRDAWYGDMGNLGLADHKSVIERLASQCSCIDLDRVGIMGTSAGGDAAARAMFLYPSLFKTGISASGSYDYRMAMAGWGETYQGLLVRQPDGGDNYPVPTYALAKNLQGRLLVSYGTLDDNVNPATSLNLIAALERADKDFDLIVVPDQGHWPQESPNYIRHLWDYLVDNLAGQKPPANYHIAPKPSDDDSEAP